jgi:hypothetical protein
MRGAKPHVIARYEAIPNRKIGDIHVGDCFAIARKDGIRTMFTPRVIARCEAILDRKVGYKHVGDCFVPRNDVFYLNLKI